MELSWDTKAGLLQVPSVDKPESMVVSDEELDKNSKDSIESIAERLLENSKYLMCLGESELTELLQLAIRCKKEETDHEDCSKNDACTLFNIVFSASFNDLLLTKYLRKLNSEEVLVTLELLLPYLNQTIKMPSNITDRPSDLQIVNWATLIIQTHLDNLWLSNDKTSQKLLKQLKKALSVKMEEYKDFECIQNYFPVIEKKDILPQKCSVKKYCIESLDI